ncbi:MAG: tRNA1(Val) (adenine(37)-N6)-methyltransferase [Bacilli bacterium]|nr:tRNA1(Val) (adenine(37)-N6)-methyltransferase [Bacilli bacterium]
MKRLDDVLGYGLKIYQDSEFFSFSLDSIILANFCSIRLRDKKIVDFCSGNGIVPLILSKRTRSFITGVEIQLKLQKLAYESIQYNNLQNQISIECMDVKDFSINHRDEFDLVVCNPPYFKVQDNNYFNLSREKTIARHEVCLTLADLCKSAFQVLKEHGTFCVVHRSERLMDILIEFRNHHIEPKRIQFFYENIDKPSNIILVEGQKMGSVGLKIEKPYILYHLDGTMTDDYSLLQEEVLK